LVPAGCLGGPVEDDAHQRNMGNMAAIALRVVVLTLPAPGMVPTCRGAMFVAGFFSGAVRHSVGSRGHTSKRAWRYCNTC
jgi:hypothetical protein